MSFPSDVVLPANAKYIAFVDEKKNYNPNYDIIWSFQYAITGSAIGECAFATFLTATHPDSSPIPGQYLGYSGNVPLSAYLLTEDGEYMLTEDSDKIILEGNGETDGLLGVCIAFDTTGLFALSSNSRPGVSRNNIKRNSLIIRDVNDNLTFYEELSNIDSYFSILSNVKSYKTLRFKYTNTDSLTVDYKKSDSTEFKELTSIKLNSDLTNLNYLKPGFSFSSPVSSNISGSVCSLYLKNFHIQGTEKPPTTEIVNFTKF